MPTEQELCFGPYRVTPEHDQVWRGEQEVRLTPKALAVLRVLVLRAGHVVTKEEFFQAVWPDTVVSDDALTTCILELRQAFRDKAKHPRFIETVHRRGYRFLAAVTTQPVPGSQFQVHSSPFPALNTPHPAPVLVGRAADLAHLHQLLLTARNGARQIVFVTGEAGIGKTALVEAFLDSVASRYQAHDAPPWIAHGQCIEHYGPGEPYLPILDALGRLCRGPEGKQLVTLLKQYAPTWLVQMPAVLEDTEFAALQRKTAGATPERMLRELAEAVEVLAADRPLILWFEDLHWCDHATVEWLSFLARRRERARLLMLGSYRPIDVIVHDHPLRTVKQDLHVHRQCEEVTLGWLSEAEVEEYLAVRFSVGETSRSSLHRLTRLIHNRTNGNPLFMVNVVDTLVTQGVISSADGQWELRGDVDQAAAAIPAALRQMIEQQVEQLTPQAQQVLEAASVAGMEFSTAAVAASIAVEIEAAEEQCAMLARRGQFLHAHAVTEWPDGTVAARYTFLHALYQEVVYERIPAGRRQRLHQRIGEREETAYGERTREIAAELAVHFERGRDFRRAVQYVGQAAQSAMWRYAYREALDYLDRGIALLSYLPESAERLQHELAFHVGRSLSLMHARGFAAPEVEQAYGRVRELSRTVGDSPHRFAALWGVRNFHLLRGELQVGRALAQEFLELVQRTKMASLTAQAHLGLGTPLFYLGELKAARSHLEQSLTLYNSQLSQPKVFLTGQDPRASSLAHLAVLLWLLGYPDQARERSRQALTLAQDTMFPYGQALALNLTAILHACCRDFEAVAHHAEAAQGFAQECGVVHLVAMGMVLQGWAWAMQGKGDEGIAIIQSGLKRQQVAGTGIGEVSYQLLLTEVYTQVGQREAAIQALTEAFASDAKTSERTFEPELYRLYGELSLRAGERANGRTGEEGDVAPLPNLPFAPSSPEECFRTAIEVARRQQAKALELRAVTSLARLWYQQGKRPEAHTLLSHIYTWFTEGWETRDLQEAKLLLDELAADSPVSRA